MGGFVSLTQAIEDPDFADFIICGVSSYKVAGHDFILSKFVNEIIESDPDYNKGEMTYSLIRTLRLANLAEFNFGLSKKALRDMSNEELGAEFENFGNESLNVDIYDVKYCNESCMNYDVENDLDKIKSKVLIISCKQDPHFPPELDGIPMSEMIDESELIVMDSDLGHLCDYGDAEGRKFIEYTIFGLSGEQIKYLDENLTESTFVKGNLLKIKMYFEDKLYPFQSEVSKIRLDDFISREEIEMNVFLSSFLDDM